MVVKKMMKFENVKYKNIVEIENLEIHLGKITSIVGSSGSGKTTLLRMINKMISPSEGNIYYNEIDLKNINSVELRREIAMLSQNASMFEGTIEENLNSGLLFQDREKISQKEAYKILSDMKLNKKLEDKVDNLSGGEKQRLALARIIALDPKIYLLDEPTSALDKKTEQDVFDFFNSIIKVHKKTLIMVTHSKELAEKFSDEIVKIEKGKIVRE